MASTCCRASLPPTAGITSTLGLWPPTGLRWRNTAFLVLFTKSSSLVPCVPAQGNKLLPDVTTFLLLRHRWFSLEIRLLLLLWILLWLLPIHAGPLAPRASMFLLQLKPRKRIRGEGHLRTRCTTSAAMLPSGWRESRALCSKLLLMFAQGCLREPRSTSGG